MRSQGRRLPPKLDRQVDTKNHSSQEQKPPWEPVPRQEHLNDNWQVAGDSVWIRFEGYILSGTPVMGNPQTFTSFSSRSLTRFSQWILEFQWIWVENPFLPLPGQEEIHRTTLFLPMPILRRNYVTKAWPTGVLSESNWPRGRKYPTSELSSHLVQLAGRRNWEMIVKSTAQTHSLIRRLRPKCRMIASLPSPTLYQPHH